MKKSVTPATSPTTWTSKPKSSGKFDVQITPHLSIVVFVFVCMYVLLKVTHIQYIRLGILKPDFK